MAKNSYDIIVYKNDFFGKGTIKKAIVYEVNSRYPFFMKVIDYPLNKRNLNKRMIWTPTEKKAEISQLEKSGDWCIIGNVLVNEKRFK